MTGWIALVLTMCCTWMLSNKDGRGWMIGIVGNVFWIVSLWGYPPSIAMNVILAAIGVHGWYNWRVQK